MDKNLTNYLNSFPTLKLTIFEDKKILLIEINREKSLNAMNYQFFQDINNLFSKITIISSEIDIRVIILRGVGKHFTAGLDLKDPSSINLNNSDDVGRNAYKIYDKLKWLQECFSVIEKCHIPVIASVQGYCLGGGLNLIPSCDYTICSKDSVFSIKETSIGLVADLGVFQRLIKNGGNVGLIKKYSYTGEFFGWDTALKMGVVGEVAENSRDLEEKTFALAEKLGSMSPLVSWGIKRIINFSRDNSINTSLEMIATMNGALVQSNEVEKSVRAVLTKSKAIYPKL